MSKRRNRKSAPNLPKATLDRARRQIDGEDVNEAPDDEVIDEAEDIEEDEPEAEEAPEPAGKATAAPVGTGRRSRRERRSGSTSRRRGPAAPLASSQRQNKEQLEVDVIQDMLLNPTKELTEQQLRQEYSHVLKDLRDMLILAAILMLVMTAMAQFI